jgi:hypothetical protein
MTMQLLRQVRIFLENLIRACPVHRTMCHMFWSSGHGRRHTCVTNRWTLVLGVWRLVGNEIVAHMYMTNKKERRRSYNNWISCLKVVVLHHRSSIFLRTTFVGELSVTSKLSSRVSSLHHLYIPILGPHAKVEGVSTPPRAVSCVPPSSRLHDVYP